MLFGLTPVRSTVFLRLRAAPVIFLTFWSDCYGFAKRGRALIEPMTLHPLRYGLAMLELLLFRRIRKPRWLNNARYCSAVALIYLLIQREYYTHAFLAMTRGMNAGMTAIIMALQPSLVTVAGFALSALGVYTVRTHARG